MLWKEIFIKNSTKNVALTLVSGPFMIIKNKAQPVLESENFETNWY